MKESVFEDIIAKYPEVIEDGLKPLGRQVNVEGKRIDLLFQDKHGQKLIIELKAGTIKQKDIAQIMDYEGYFVSPDGPAIRVMLVGNRVPPNLQRALDYHGIEWKEIPLRRLESFLNEKGDKALLRFVSEEVPEDNSTEYGSENEVTLSPGEERKVAEMTSSGLFDKDEAYRTFFQDLVDELRTKHEFTRGRKVGTGQPWHEFSSGVPGVIFQVYCIPKDGKIRVELYIEFPEKHKNKSLFDALRAQQKTIEKEYGAALSWERLDNKRASRIAVYREGRVDTTPEKRAELLRWSIENLLRMKAVMLPKVKAALRTGD